MRVSPAFQPAWPMRRMHIPVVSPLLEKRGWSAVTVGIAVVHLILSARGLPSLGCPIRALTGIPCPGCGLTTACLDLARGEPTAALEAHLFAPLFLLLLGLLLAAVILPRTQRDRLIQMTTALEERTGVSQYGTAALVLYWGFRLFHL